jgi:membrane protein
MVNFKEIWKLLKQTISEWQFNQVSLLASSLAYYTVFSLAPLMIIIIMIVGAMFGKAAAKGEVVGRIQGVVGVVPGWFGVGVDGNTVSNSFLNIN